MSKCPVFAMNCLCLAGDWSWGSVSLSSANSWSHPILFMLSDQMGWGQGIRGLNGKDLRGKWGTYNIFDKGPWLEQRSHLILCGATCPLLDGVWAQFSESVFPHSSSGAVALPMLAAKGMLSGAWHDFYHARLIGAFVWIGIQPSIEALRVHM